MPLINDGDLIRGLGYVALYSAYLEEAVDEVVLKIIDYEKTVDASIMKLPVSRKLRYIERTMTEWPDLSRKLEHFKKRIPLLIDLFDERNIIIHGRIYADPKTGDTLKPARSGYPSRPAVAEELYELANCLFAERETCNHISTFAIARYAKKRAT